jgi:Protein of unknown function (DUF3592)
VQLQELLKLCFYIALYGMLFFSIWQLLKSISASKWPKTKGEIIYSGVEEEYDSEGSTYKPHIEYKYSVNGKEYLSKIYAFGYMSSSFRFLSRNIVNSFPSKSSVLVYYNSKKHSESVLMAGIKLFHVVQILFLCVFLIIIRKL